ncbi:MAG: hypothetical protein WBQ72_03620 [Terriglobales bacterium]
MKRSTKRGLMVRAVCVLTMVLVCAMGIVQAVHAHPESSTAPHHACSICSTAHAGLSTERISTAPMLVATAFAPPPLGCADIFRPTVVPSIRPPPSN